MDEAASLEPAVSRMASVGPLMPDGENDDWLRSKIGSVLRMHADGRMRGAELVSLLKVDERKKWPFDFFSFFVFSGCCEES